MDKLSTKYNPDILNCLANLSNDEVFTPPQLVNNMLDLLPKELWSNPNIKFLDPSCKTGVFLREIVKRLNYGLENVIPDLQERINHILINQVYGIGITELTSLMSRRTIYCSKIANGSYSICDTFSEEDGNIYFSKIEHEWEGTTCTICGATKAEYDRSAELENHAYAFIHKEIKEMFDMKFDVIIGNPPYHLSDGGGDGNSSVPLYHKFVKQAKNLNPKYITMIIPARWYSGGKGLDSFREEMINDTKIKKLVDFPNAQECFPDVRIEGGVCYFLWDCKHNGLCEVKNINNGKVSVMHRYLSQENQETFIRYNEAISIYQKVNALKEETFDKIVSSRKPFGFDSKFKGVDYETETTVKLYINKKISSVDINDIKKNVDFVDKPKIFISKAYGMKDAPYQVINKPIVDNSKSCCNETYLLVGPFDTEEQSLNVKKYMETKFFRFLVFLIKNTQNAPKKVYSYVPIQNWNENWTDEKLYKKYGLNNQEIEFIESMIKPMNGTEK